MPASLSELESPDAEPTNERRILRIAMRHFAARGYVGASTRSMAAEAEVTAPMVNYYFGGKEGLYRRLAELVMTSVSRSFEEALDAPLPFRERLRAVAKAHLDLAAESPDGVGLLFGAMYGPTEGAPTLDIVGWYAPLMARLVMAFHDAVASGEFMPRPGAFIPFLAVHFIDSTHQLVMHAYKARRFGAPPPILLPDGQLPTDGVLLDATLRQFFDGAGHLTATPEAPTPASHLR